MIKLFDLNKSHSLPSPRKYFLALLPSLYHINTLLSLHYILTITLGNMKRLSNLVINGIKRLLHERKSAREIARKVGVSIGSVLNVRKEVLETIPILKAGRPSKISERARRFLVREYDCGRITTPKQGQKLLKSIDGVDISRCAVGKILKKQGLKTYIQQKKPSLTDDQKESSTRICSKSSSLDSR